MTPPHGTRPDGGVSAALGDPRALPLLQELVSIAPTNLEDLAGGRFEKPNYPRAAEAIVRAARSFGLATRIYDPVVAGVATEELRGISRPNVIVDLDAGASSTVLILAHYDVVPVPTEQRARWKSPPHTLTLRSNGRLYARGSNDDLGSGVVASLIALAHLADDAQLPRNVRLLACCDEETGGEGGIEALRAHDDTLPPGDLGRFLTSDVALIPDGSPETTVGSSGVAFLEGSFGGRVPISEAVAYGEALVDLHPLAASWNSAYASPDWPDRGAPAPVLTGRASVTKFDIGGVAPSEKLRLVAAHSETDAANQIARAVTLVFEGPPAALGGLAAQLTPLVPSPFQLEPAGATALSSPKGALALQLIGQAAHGGYPHRGHNPVPRRSRSSAAPSSGNGSIRTRPVRRCSRSTSDFRPRWSSPTACGVRWARSRRGRRSIRFRRGSKRRRRAAVRDTPWRWTTRSPRSSTGSSGRRWGRTGSGASTAGPTRAPCGVFRRRRAHRSPRSSSAAWTMTPTSTMPRRASTRSGSRA